MRWPPEGRLDLIEDVGGLSRAPGPRPHVRCSSDAHAGCCASGLHGFIPSPLVLSINPFLQEECIVTSSYEAPPPPRPTYDSGPPQPAAQGPPQQHHAAPMPGPHQV